MDKKRHLRYLVFGLNALQLLNLLGISRANGSKYKSGIVLKSKQ